MTKIGFCGLGKLGLPCALACESKGHQVAGYDINPRVEEIIRTRKLPYLEQGAQELLAMSSIQFVPLAEVVKQSDIIFVPIQTPHDPRYEGVTRMPRERVDFDYSFLKAGVKAIADEVGKLGEDRIVVIISTVLPGTIEREIKPLLNKHVKLCYTPYFIAMGTTIHDFLHPEFTLLGVDDPEAADVVEKFYHTIHDRPVKRVGIREAEAVKVFYNTFISTKIAFANTVMEICHKLGVDSDVVIDALSSATDRIISPRYMRGGMGDSGGCHPRDNIALSHLAKQYNLSFDWFETIMIAREKQTEWLADMVQKEGKGMQKVILGYAYKPETNLTVGSSAILLKNILEERGEQVIMYDPHVEGETDKLPNGAACFFIGTKHPDFIEYKFPPGSVILDPWRYIPNHKSNLRIIHVGGTE